MSINFFLRTLRFLRHKVVALLKYPLSLLLDIKFIWICEFVPFNLNNYIKP